MNAPVRIAERTETPARFSIDEFLELVASSVMIDAGKLELVDGIVVRMSPALSPHMRYQRQVYDALRDIFGTGLDGYIAQFNLSLQLGDATLREADVGVVLRFDEEDRFPDPRSVLLLVEIAHSTLEKDLGDKRLDYAGADIPHYWVVDVGGRRVHAMSTPLDGDYAERRLIAFGVPIAVPGTNRTITVD